MNRHYQVLATLFLFALTSGSLRAERGAQGGQRFDRQDTDGNGSISREEFTAARSARLASRFEAIDADGDGLATAAEFEQVRANAPRNAQVQGRQRARNGQSGGGPQGRPNRPAFADLDANGDGSLSLAEFTTHHELRADQVFDRLDANGDGGITRAEMRSARSNRGGSGEKPRP